VCLSEIRSKNSFDILKRDKVVPVAALPCCCVLLKIIAPQNNIVAKQIWNFFDISSCEDLLVLFVVKHLKLKRA